MATAPLCARFHRAIELIGGRWTGPVLQLLMSGPARFAELRDSIPHISDRMLSERLHELEVEGLVVRTVIPASPVRPYAALDHLHRALLDSAEFRHLVRRRWRISLVLTALLFVLYYGYIVLIAVNKPFLARRIGAVTTLGIPMGVAVIVGSWV